jgi:hypothetical protein
MPTHAHTCSEAYHWVKDRRPQIAITRDDAARLQAAEAAVLGPNASGFQVPVGQQPTGGAGQAMGGAGPFGWPAFGLPAFGGAAAAAAAAGVPALQPGQQPSLNFATSPTQGAFVFGASPTQPQQQQQHHHHSSDAHMME